MGKGRGGKDGLTPEDFQLWKAFTRDIEPFGGALEGDGPDVEPSVATQKDFMKPAAASKTDLGATSRSQQTTNFAQPPQLDARTEARLRRGQMPIEGRLDLHGMTQERAHARLNDFVLDAQAAGKRCILVITGKGRSAEDVLEERPVGILKQKLPLWLSVPPLQGLVLKVIPATPRDGGGGAWYLYLKRQRDY